MFPLLYIVGIAIATVGFIRSNRLQQLSTDYKTAAETGRALLAQLQSPGRVLVLPFKPQICKEDSHPLAALADQFAAVAYWAQPTPSLWEPYLVRKGDSLAE